MNILIVESKAKCKTLLKHLGEDDWRVLPTGGHVNCLAEDRSRHPPKKVKKAYWANRPGDLPDPEWFWTDRGESAIRKIKKEAAKHDSVSFYLAADPDREGERIAWHLEKLLAPIGNCYRVTFQEITKSAVLSAVANAHEVDQQLVDASLVRTFIDRLVGWRASKIAKRYTSTHKNSMGRVQTPTLGFVVERELEREAHVPVRYFEVRAATSVADWRIHFHEKSDSQAWADEKGKFSAYRTADKHLAERAFSTLSTVGSLQVENVHRRQKSQPPPPPFSTDSLLQAAGSRWGWSPTKTAALAGKLYEAGHLTYIRTDSTRLAVEAVSAGRAVIENEWGEELLGQVVSAEAQAGIQDAHEAIRPTHLELVNVPNDDADLRKLYTLVRARTLASLMVPSVRVSLSLNGVCTGLDRKLDARVGWYSEPGWRHAFEGSGLSEKITTTPLEISIGMEIYLIPCTDDRPNPELIEDETKPPARYKAHSLVKVMKEKGIGRPSTYAKTVERLKTRGYVTIDSGAVAPTDNGRNVWLKAAPLFSIQNGRRVFNSEYTAEMEMLLDDIAEGQCDACAVWEKMRDEFKAAHESARQAGNTGSLLPRTRHRLEEYLQAIPELAGEIGDLNEITEQAGRDCITEFRARGIDLLSSEEQKDYLKKLLEATGLTLDQATESAGVTLDGNTINRSEISVLINHLKTLQEERKTPTDAQLRFINDLVKKCELSEASACELVAVNSYDELTGGRSGTASELINELKKLV